MSPTFLAFIASACVSLLACGGAAFQGYPSLAVLAALLGAAMGLSAMLVAITEPEADKR